MFGMRYIQTCHGCNTVFEFKRAKDAERFAKEHNRHCPCCGGWLSQSPFPHTMLTPPPDLKAYPAYVRTIDMDNACNMLDFGKWPRRVN